MSDPLAAMRANMRSFYRQLGEHSPGGSVLEREGVIAAIVPSCPNRSVVNAVVYDDASALGAARAEIEAAYWDAGVTAWMVWVPEQDRQAGELLESAGHRLDSRPRAMVLDILQAPAAPATAAELDWERTSDAGALAALNARAYGLPSGEFDAAMSELDASRLSMYLARLGGEPAACVGSLCEDGDCGIYFVATAPSAQRRGLASALMRQALVDAREAGCSTSSLQASAAGAPVYTRLGYGDLGAIEMWERRSG